MKGYSSSLNIPGSAMHGYALVLCRGQGGLRFTQGQYRAPRVGQYPIDGAFASQILEDRAIGGAQNDQACAGFRGGCQNLNGRVAMHNMRLNGGAAVHAGLRGPRLSGKNLQLMQGGRVE